MNPLHLAATTPGTPQEALRALKDALYDYILKHHGYAIAATDTDTQLRAHIDSNFAYMCEADRSMKFQLLKRRLTVIRQIAQSLEITS